MSLLTAMLAPAGAWSPLAASISVTSESDGLTQWRAVFESVQRHMDAQQHTLVIVSLVIVGLLVLWLNVRIARRILRQAPARSGR